MAWENLSEKRIAQLKKLHSKTRRHGLCDTPEYQAWADMKVRCTSPNNAGYHRYGGRGIKVCERWMVFDNFIADMGERPHGYSIERINVDGDYCPENCKWIPRGEQAKNLRKTRLITFNGITQHLRAWARYFGVDSKTLSYYVDHYGESLGMSRVQSKHGVAT